jgi:hypothetical protein
MRRAWPLLLLAGAACHRAEPAPPAATAQPGSGRITAVALVDSVVFDTGTASVLRRVEVQLGSRRDTIPGVLTVDLPGVLADTAVVGFGYDQDSVTGVFVYAPARRSVTRRALVPALRDFAPSFATPSFAPDGRSFLYIAYDSGQDSVRPTLRRWPSLDVVATGPGVQVGVTDVAPYATEWRGPDTAVATFSLSACPAPLSLRTFFDLSRETMRSDTVLELNEPVGTHHWWPWRDSVPVAIPGMHAWLVASTQGPRLGPAFVLAIRDDRTTVYADSVRDVDFQLEGGTCPGVPVSGPQAARDAFLGSVSDTVWSPLYRVVAPNRLDDYESPPRLISYRWSQGGRVVRKAIAWNYRTRRLDLLTPQFADSAATP